MPLFSWQSCLLAGVLLIDCAAAFTGSEYRLSHEYSGTNFFDGWDFYSGRDPTGGFVTYYSRSSAQLTGLISTTETGPAYMGVNYADKLPFDNKTGRGDGAGRPSVRIASKQAFTHGLFIGDFAHIPAGICGTWPAFWTLGPNWPYTGEVDILEGVNQNMYNTMSLHTNQTCEIEGDSSVMTGQLGNTDCAYYPDYNVGCGVSDTRTTSFGKGFNEAGGGVFAMQWTSEYIRIWHWSRTQVPSDVNSKSPDPGSWGLPAAQLGVGNCTVDQHFQSHKIIFDTTFCGEYAGNPFVWKTNDATSCEASTGLATCDNYVANNPAAFRDAYWSVNYVRVYQLVNPAVEGTVTTYIASEQPPNTATNAFTAPNTVSTPVLDADSLCPKYNFSIISDGKYHSRYEIACDYDPPGPDIIGDPYPGFRANSLADCLRGCSYMNENNGINRCGGVAHLAEINFCYFKKYIDGNLNYRPGYNMIRLIYYGYPQVTDDPRSPADSTLTSIFVETIPTPQTYRPSTSTSRSTTTSMADTSTTTASLTITIAPPPMGDNSTSTSSTIPSDYSETVTSGYLSSTSTKSTATSSTVSTDPSATNADFYIVFNIDASARRLLKREIRYLTFDSEGQSILTVNEGEAAKFRLNSNGDLMSGDLYVVLDSSVQPPRFLLTEEEPQTPITVNVDENGSVIIHGASGYCLTPNGELAVETDSQGLPDECTPVQPVVVAAPGNTTSTTTMTTTISMTRIESNSTTSSRSSTSTSSFTASLTSGINSPTNSTAGTSTMTTTRTSTLPTILNSFVYAGCFGVPASAASISGISSPFTDNAMTNDKCTKHCGEQNAYYAGTYGVRCFCGTSEALYASLITYPDATCNEPCPGANRDICGGEVGFQGAVPTTSSSALIEGRKLFKRQSAIFLISLYNNTELLGGPGETDVPSTTDTATETVTDTVTFRPSDTDVSFPPESVSFNVTGTNTATVISTTYVDVCHACPGGLTTKATTITVPHCGCTASYDAKISRTVKVLSPVVPMSTMTKTCTCGHDGAESVITVTIPHASSIAQLVSQLPATMPSPEDGPSKDDAAIGTSQSPAIEQSDLVSPASVPVGMDRFDAESDIMAPDDATGTHVPEDADSGTNMDINVFDENISSIDVNRSSAVNPAYDEYAAAAPASPPIVVGASNIATPEGISNYTSPAYENSNSTKPNPVASFTSRASYSHLVRDSWGLLGGKSMWFHGLIVGTVIGFLAIS